MSFTDRFGGVAGDYRRYRPRYPQALFDWLAAQCERRALAWDCACGNGQATVGIAAHFRRVVATDASARQLAQAPRLANVDWRVAPAEASGLPDASADLVSVAQALHWLPLAAFHAEVERVLVGGGAYAVIRYGRLQIDAPAVEALVQHYYDDVVGPYWPPERRTLDAGYRDLPLPYPLIARPSFDMVARWQALDLLGYLRSWSATTAFIAARAYDPLNALAPVLARAWPAGSSTVEIRWPLEVLLGRKPASPPESSP
ncbi:MAG TPA: methyltransferase domain-containing protein [Gammaproteobacteria bacterium]|nr:methyltransferase domain-containing protein [Gammaproteobacteria bacterium]